MSDSSRADVASLMSALRQFVAERDWAQFHDPKNLAMAVASEAGELLAELRWISNRDADAAVREPKRRERIETEVGDVLISLLLFCERAGIDPLAAAERKMMINARNYPAGLSTGRPERPADRSRVGDFARVIAVDWSGKREGGHDTIWLAEVRDGQLSALENGRSREQVTDRLIEIAREEPNTVIGLDFAFAFPAWFMTERGLKSVADLWAMVAKEGELWLRECPKPFWGRPGIGKPPLPSHFRSTEQIVGRRFGGQPKSVFQIGGAGAVGTGSIRGMPQLLRMKESGLSIWPFDPARRPFVVEIYPRVLTGAVVKSSRAEREAYLARHFDELPTELCRNAAGSEDAFDAAVSALVMWRNQSELATLSEIQHPDSQIEGEIWAPASH